MIKKFIHHGLSLGKSTTAKHLYWVFSGNIIGIILTFITLILVIANTIPKADYGIFLALFTLANLLSDLGEAGLGSTLSRFIPPLLTQNKSSEARLYLSTAFYIELGIGLVIGLGIILLAPLLSQKLFAQTPIVNVVTTGVLTTTMVLFGFSIFALSSYKKFIEVSVITIGYNVVRLALLIVLWWMGRLSILSILIVYTVSSLITWIYSLVFLSPDFLIVGTGKKCVRDLLSFSGFLAIQKIFVSISSRLDVLMLVPLSSPLEASVYGIGSRFSLVYPVFIGSLGQVLAPKFAEFAKAHDSLKFFRKVVFVVGLLLFSQALFYIFAPFLMHVLVPKYPEAVPVFQALLIAMIGFVAATPFVSFLIYTLKKPHITSISSLVQLIIIFFSNIYFIPKWGRFGPIVGIGLGNIAVFLIAGSACWYYLQKESV